MIIPIAENSLCSGAAQRRPNAGKAIQKGCTLESPPVATR